MSFADFDRQQVLTKCKLVKWSLQDKEGTLLPLEIEETLAREVRLEIYFEGKTFFLEASPHNLDELVLGHACLEIVPEDCCPVIVKRDGYRFWLEARKKHQSGSLSAQSVWTITPEQILTLSEQFRNWPGLWEQTGCFHKAFAWDVRSRNFLFKVEDISRHNCIDRIAGLACKQEFDLKANVVFVSSRITASLIKKVIHGSFGMIVSLSAISESALQIAMQCGITLIGFARKGRFTVFADPFKRVYYAK